MPSFLKARAPDCHLIADRGFESASNLAAMMAEGIDFIIPCSINTRAVKALVTEFSKDAMKSEFERIHGGHVYSVKETELGILGDDSGGYSYVTSTDKGFDDADYRMKAYVCFDSKKRSDDEQELKSALMKIVSDLDGKRAGDPEAVFSGKAKWASKYLEMTVDGDGKMRIGYKQNGCPSSGTGRECS